QVPGVLHTERQNGGYRLALAEGTAPEDVLRTLVNTPGVQVQRFERVRTSLDEIFVQVVGHRVETGQEEAQP
ncbi:MAG: DUF4162 domain-containing protein, partial [Anaerolineae bacterium]